MAIKESLQDSSLDQFRDSDGWSDRCKYAYVIKEYRIFGETGDVVEETTTSWMEINGIWTSLVFFKALPDKGLVKKGKEAKGSKKSKPRFTIGFCINATGEKIDETVVIWKSKEPRCFKRLSDKSRPGDAHYFSNPKSWTTSNIMQAVLARFNRKLLLEQRKVVLILHNAMCHPKSIRNSFS